MAHISVIIGFCVFLVSNSFAEQRSIYSASRDPNLSFEQYFDKLRLFRPESYDPRGNNPYDSAKNLKEWTFNDVPDWSEKGKMNEVFAKIRDGRFLVDKFRTDFPRRIAWLFPDDGCFVRAELMRVIFQRNHLLDIKKIFVFGNLTVNTSNSPSGNVSWWYHVAPLIKHNGVLFVIDPAIETKKPLLLTDWLMRMSPNIDDVKIAVCESGSFVPDSKCFNPSVDDDQAFREEQEYLNHEWSRQVELNRNPYEVLGEFPPWK